MWYKVIFSISDEEFRNIMNNSKFNLPIRWDGRDFEKTLQNLFSEYLHELRSIHGKGNSDLQIEVDIKEIRKICDFLVESVRSYHNGFPSTAFSYVMESMKILIGHPLKVYQKNGVVEPDTLNLFRLRNVKDGIIHSRKDIFHVPACARSMIATNRYSIAGYPSLYLTTSIQLGAEEISADNSTIVSRFKIIRDQYEFNMRVLDLGIKPQDFRKYEEKYSSGRDLRDVDLNSKSIRSNYLKWYPLVAACSFIRADKNAPFSSEYIVPQLLMQWVRKQIVKNSLMGIRYFSCASVRASEMGFDYVFPVSNTDYEDNYCTLLRNEFMLTPPVYLREYDSVRECEEALINSNELDKI